MKRRVGFTKSIKYRGLFELGTQDSVSYRQARAIKSPQIDQRKTKFMPLKAHGRSFATL